MKSVGIKQLKARLSEYVRLARTGEIILVSDRDDVVAELGPPRHRMPAPGSIHDNLERLADRGWITRAGQPKMDWTWVPPSLDLPSESVRTVLDDLRSDR